MTEVCAHSVKLDEAVPSRSGDDALSVQEPRSCSKALEVQASVGSNSAEQGPVQGEEQGRGVHVRHLRGG